jgi:hypothetical protein
MGKVLKTEDSKAEVRTKIATVLPLSTIFIELLLWF